MDQVEIVHLELYRERREARFRRALALHASEPDRSRILQHLWQTLCRLSADRAAVVWLDEYGPGLAHPHTLLDLASDRPRRIFSPIPLRSAWETSVPGLLDFPQVGGQWEKTGGGIASACVVALGSDGPRSWFLVVDSLTPRPRLKDKAAGEVMFSAGEIASVVLHRDLDLARRRRVSGSSSSEGLGLRSDPESFSGWPVLKDLEGRMGDEEVKERIGSRFLVARAVRGLLEDELVADEESLRYQVRSTRDALASSEECHSECADWDRVLGALDAFDFQDLTSSLLEWGKKVEQQGHLHGALEILGLAFELARFTGSPHQAADAARFKGKVFRTRAEWDQAVAWYGVARTIAEEIGSPDKLAAVLDGLANAYRDLGNLPRAREILLEVLEIGRKNGARYASAIGHHDLMTVEKLRGNLADAVQHGWQAVHDYDSREGSLRALFDLSGVLRESGELAAARDGYLVVAQQVAGFEYRILALDALAFIAALQGDHAEHLRVRDRMEVEGWQELSPVYQGQVLYYRGLSARALGCPEEAREWLEKALSYAETHSLNKLIFDVEEALVGDVPSPERPAAPPKAPEPVGKEIGEVRQGLRELRETLVKVGSDLLL